MENYTFITTIPSVGTITGAIIIGEIGDIHRFQGSSQLLAYAGLDPSIYESSEFKSKKCRISKRGSRYLRPAIFTSTRYILNYSLRTCKYLFSTINITAIMTLLKITIRGSFSSL